MIDFTIAVKNALEEQDKTIQNLFDDNVVSKNTFYKYVYRTPSLKTIFKIANYLEVSLDYLFEFTDENNFNKYSLKNENFYDNLIALLKTNNISGRKFCNDLNYSISNINRWEKGINPTLQTLFEISNYLKCSLDDLLIKF